MSLHHRAHLKLIVIAVTLLYSSFSQAENIFFPLSPRLNITGGTGDNTYGATDIMAPLFGSRNAIFYTDVDGQTGKGNSWLGSLGLGTRDALNNDFMLGGYVFADQSQSNDDVGPNHWTVINPGVEFMTNNWDGRINAYIPAGAKEKTRGTFFGDQVDMPSAVTFTAHDQFSRLFNKVEEIGPGIDADAGYTFTHLRHFRVHGGGYYFRLSDTGDINGAEAGAEMPINHYLALQLDDSYDNVQKNTAVVSIRFTLGGIHQSVSTPTVQDRILDPIHRHLGALSTNTGIPSNQSLVEIDGMPVLERDNVWFFNATNGVAFDPDAGNNNCTFEHPCIGTDFTQGNIGIINGIDSDANFFFTPGTYNIDGDSNRLSLYSGQSMYGRDGSYALPASSSSGFPTFVGGLDPEGNNVLDSFALINNNSAEDIGINILNANNVVMNNLQIGGANQAQNYPIAPVRINHSENVTLSNSSLFLNSDIDRIGENHPQSGVDIINASTANITGNTISVISNGPQSGSSTTAININGGSSATIADNTLTITGKNSQGTNGIGIVSINVNNESTATIDNNNITFDMTNAREGMTSIYANNDSVLNVNNNIISMTLTKPPGNSDPVTGILAQGSATVNSNGNTFTITSTSNGSNIGLYALGGTIHSSNDNFTFNNFGSSSADATGIYTLGSAVTATNDVFHLNMTTSTGITNLFGTVTGDNNIFNFNGSGTKTCGSFTSGTGNQFNGGCI